LNSDLYVGSGSEEDSYPDLKVTIKLKNDTKKSFLTGSSDITRISPKRDWLKKPWCLLFTGLPLKIP
jgi:hypothetical protein